MALANQGDGREQLVRVYRAAIAAVEPASLIRARFLAGATTPLRVGGNRTTPVAARTWLIAAGKAAGAMARETSRILGRGLAGGIVALPHRARGLPPALRQFVAGHPLPNRRSLEAGTRAAPQVARCR